MVNVPGAEFVEKTGSHYNAAYYCTHHEEYIVPAVVRVDGEETMVCQKCLEDALGKAIETATLAEECSKRPVRITVATPIGPKKALYRRDEDGKTTFVCQELKWDKSVCNADFDDWRMLTIHLKNLHDDSWTTRRGHTSHYCSGCHNLIAEEWWESHQRSCAAMEVSRVINKVCYGRQCRNMATGECAICHMRFCADCLGVYLDDRQMCLVCASEVTNTSGYGYD